MSRRPCGTPAAYLRHVRHGEPPCEPCREAWNAYYRRRRAAMTERGPWTHPDDRAYLHSTFGP